MENDNYIRLLGLLMLVVILGSSPALYYYIDRTITTWPDYAGGSGILSIWAAFNTLGFVVGLKWLIKG